MISFTVPGRPVAKQRPRFTHTRRGTLTYTPGKTKEYEELVAWHAKLARAKRLDGPVAVTLRFYGARGDWDNLAKSCCDALNGICYLDDDQVVEAHVYVKRRAKQPRAEITIEAWGPSIQRDDRDAKVCDVIIRWLAQRTTDHDAICAIAHLYSPTLVPDGQPDDPDLTPPF